MSSKPINHKSVERICKEHNMLSKIKRKKFLNAYYATRKESSKKLPKNMLNQDFTTDFTNKKFFCDINYIRTNVGWLCFSSLIDLFNREIKAISISKINNEPLTLDKFNKLKANTKGSLLHTDQGSNYISFKFKDAIKKAGITYSVSRRGNC